jgi:hypothetical protein
VHYEVFKAENILGYSAGSFFAPEFGAKKRQKDKSPPSAEGGRGMAGFVRWAIPYPLLTLNWEIGTLRGLMGKVFKPVTSIRGPGKKKDRRNTTGLPNMPAVPLSDPGVGETCTLAGMPNRRAGSPVYAIPRRFPKSFYS